MGQIEKNEGRKPDNKGESVCVGGRGMRWGEALERSREEGRARARCGTHWMSHLVWHMV